MPVAPAVPVSPISERQFNLPDEAATVAFGERFAAALRSDDPGGPRLRAGLHVHLLGDLGAGKTTLVRATLRALGHRGRVRSPTYTLVEPYRIDDVAVQAEGTVEARELRETNGASSVSDSRDAGGIGSPSTPRDENGAGSSPLSQGFDVFHFDLYRFADPAEWAEAGFREYFNEGALCLVEWPQKAGTLIGVPDLSLSLDLAGEGRVLIARAYSARGKDCLDRC